MLEDVRLGLSFLVSVAANSPASRRRWRARSSSIGGAICGEDFMQTRPDAGDASGSATSIAPSCRRCCAKGLPMTRPDPPSPVSARAAWAAASRSCSPMPATRVTLVDFKRAIGRAVREARSRGARAKSRKTLASLARFGLFDEAAVETVIARVSVVPEQRRAAPRSSAPASSSKACRKCSSSSARRWRAPRNSPGPTPIIASTTSTILVDDLSGAVEHPAALPQRALAQSGVSGAAGRDFARRSTPIRPSPRA